MRPNTVTFDAFNDAWEMLRRHWGLYALCFLVFYLLTLAVNLPLSAFQQAWLNQAMQSTANPADIVLSPMYWGMILGQSLVSVLIFPLQIAIARMGLMSRRGVEPGIGMLFELNGRYGSLFLYGLLWTLLTTVGMFLCVIPGLVIGVLLLPGGLLVLDKGLTPVDAVSQSLRDMAPNLLVGIGVAIVAVLVAVAGFFACGVGLLFTAPIMFLIQAAVYRQLYPDPVGPQPGDGPGEYYRPPQYGL